MEASHFSSPDALTNLLAAPADVASSVRFSSLAPWVLAVVLSLGLWAVLGLSIWCLVHRM
jgi:hypothetical protein